MHARVPSRPSHEGYVSGLRVGRDVDNFAGAFGERPPRTRAARFIDIPDAGPLPRDTMNEREADPTLLERLQTLGYLH